MKKNDMKERPILFSAPMVRALLDGSKTQTRRIAPVASFDIKNQSDGMVTWHICFNKAVKGVLASFSGGKLSHDQTSRIVASQFNPYGQPGDRLWVRETWANVGTCDPGLTVYRADYPACVPCAYENVPPSDAITWKPSIHMFRKDSRITLEITGVRVERLQDISEADCIAEGCAAKHTTDADWSARQAYTVSWESINGGGNWAANPWVWVIEFKVLQK